MRNASLALSTFGLLSTAAACGSDDLAAGTFTMTVYGEAFIEEGIPADVFVDGWAVSFDTFLVSVGAPAIEAGHDATPVTGAAMKIIDLALPSAGAGHEVATLAAPGGVYNHFGYVVGHDATATAGNADAADVAAMQAAGYGLWVMGSATDGTVTKTFDWGFTQRLTYGHCEIAATLDGGTITAQATIHADHLFYDDAVATEPGVAFQALADADADADDVVTLVELEAIDLAAFERYQVGSLPIDDLRAFVEHQVTTVGHVDGEGHCEDVDVE